MDYTLKEVHDNLWHRVKIMAATQQKTIKAIIIELLTKAVNDFERNSKGGKIK